jgi:DNA polymerase III alpha subunit
MMWALPQLLSVRKPTSRARVNGAAGVSRVSGTSYLAQATGSEGAGKEIDIGMQIMMGDLGDMRDMGAVGDFVRDTSGTKILGSNTLRIEVPDLEDYTAKEKLKLEQEALGFAVSHNEMELVQVPDAVLSSELHKYADRDVTVAGVLAAGHRHTCKDGSVMLFLSVQDREGLIEAVLFPDAYKAHGEILATCGNGPYLISGRAQVSGKGRGIGIQVPYDLRPTDAVAIKMHPVIVAEKLTPLSTRAAPST